jgi:hypothetical protein
MVSNLILCDMLCVQDVFIIICVYTINHSYLERKDPIMVCRTTAESSVAVGSSVAVESRNLKPVDYLYLSKVCIYLMPARSINSRTDADN